VVISAEYTAAERAYRRTALRRLRDETPWWRLERKAVLALARLALRSTSRWDGGTAETP
jgi:hypothetical protein